MASKRTPRRRRHALLALPRAVLLPGEVRAVDLAHERDKSALGHAATSAGERVLVIVAGEEDEPQARALPEIGTLARVLRHEETADGAVRVLLEGLGRVRLSDSTFERGCLWVRTEPASSGGAAEPVPRGQRELVLGAGAYAIHPTDRAAAGLPLGHAERLQLLAELDPLARERLLERLLGGLLPGSAPASPAGPSEPEVPREELLACLAVLRHQRAEVRGDLAEALRLERRILETPLTPAARRLALHELEHLRRAAPDAPDAARTRNYLEWMLELPWPTSGAARPAAADFERVRRNLGEAHVGLADVKQRIAESQAVRLLGGGARGTVLCFVGPPGTGKSSMGRAVAATLGRRYLTIPVGAMTQEREIAGLPHRLDSGMPGAILTGLHRCGSEDPVILLDEIDKLHLGTEGTSAGALLSLLDPEQNSEFFDHYLGVPFDLSRCLILATANDASEIPEALLDRMEVIEFNGYTESEKVSIARRHLLPRARAHAGLAAGQLRITPAAIRRIVRGYTEEAGVRQLQRVLFSLARKAAVSVVGGKDGLLVRLRDLGKLLGPCTVEEELPLRSPAVGVALGLAWTPAGGALLPIEALTVPGAGRTLLTGQVGDVLRESVQTAISYVRTRFREFGLAPDSLETLDLHLHFPSAATPKDGPSAGVAIATALISLLAGRPARHDVALTGETSLRGRVLSVGGLREKLLAAIRAGISEVVVPASNAEEVMRLSPEIRAPLTIHMVDDTSAAIELALVRGRGALPRSRGNGGGRRASHARSRR